MQQPQPTLDQSEYGRLNDMFFRATPARYLDNRIWALACLVGTPGDGAVFPRAFSYHGLSVTQDDETDREAYAALESTVLLHHACESLLRLYLGLANCQPCPWLALSQLRTPRAFKEAIRSLRVELDLPARRLDLLEVFSGHKTRERFNSAMPLEAWDGHQSALIELIRYSIDKFLGDAPYYNAAKHGLAIISGENSFSISNSNDVPILQQSGLAVEILEQDPRTNRWRLSTSWVDAAQTLEITSLVVRLIGSLWESSRAHYGQNADFSKIVVLHPAGVHELLTRRSSTTGPIAATWSLAHTS